MITNLLVANRGEIARRIIRTCRDLGIATVAIHSDPDADAPHVHDADAAVHLPGTAAADTYLRADLVVDAAERAGADAVHPGYGFASEDPALARAVLDAGLVWVGPPPDAMQAMASKVSAKTLMAAAGVPVLDRLDPATLTDRDLPVLVKASAGGGGRGMRVVSRRSDLPAALEAAAAEARAAFGDPTVFCERYVTSGHHVEVQVLADTRGTVWAIGERECSIQRRHQKVIEEAPSPLVERIPGLRGRLLGAAAAAAEAVGYQGAGTVEFLADDAGRFWFLEMNTRLQVEHPVTELTCGLDLVALQLHVAEGRSLPPRPPAPRGHAVEARLYAEDPGHGWRPSSGTLHRADIPADVTFGALSRPGVRLDSGVQAGAHLGVHYDPLLAKVIAWAPTRAEAVRRLAAALARARLHGPATNRDLLVRVLRHEAFAAGDTRTGFLDRHAAAVLSLPLADGAAQRLSALAAALAEAAANRAAARVQGGLPSGWRNVPSQPQRKRFRPADGSGPPFDVEYRLTRDGLVAPGLGEVRLVRHTPDEVVLTVDGVRRAFGVARYDDGLVCVDSPLGAVVLTRVDRLAEPAPAAPAGSLVAPMPGVVVAVNAAPGDRVEAGTTLVVLEAMKMQHSVAAPVAGTVTALPVGAGRQVDLGELLAVVEPPASPDVEEDPA